MLGSRLDPGRHTINAHHRGRMVHAQPPRLSQHWRQASIAGRISISASSAERSDGLRLNRLSMRIPQRRWPTVRPTIPTVERIDPDGPYSDDNIRVVCLGVDACADVARWTMYRLARGLLENQSAF